MAVYAGPHEGCTWEQKEKAGAVGGSLYDIKRVVCPPIPVGRRGLICLNNSMGGQAGQGLKPDIRRLHLVF